MYVVIQPWAAKIQQIIIYHITKAAVSEEVRAYLPAILRFCVRSSACSFVSVCVIKLRH